jgi:hypothetical protein
MRISSVPLRSNANRNDAAAQSLFEEYTTGKEFGEDLKKILKTLACDAA